MKSRSRPAVRTVVAGLALTAYVLLSHVAANLPSEEGRLAAAIVLLPYLVAAAVLAWRSDHRYPWLLLCAGLVILAWRYAGAIGDHVQWVYFIQHVGGNAIMALIFGSSLRTGRVPLCARIAIITHGPLAPRLERYTRQVTLAWTIFFAGNAGMSVLLFAYASFVHWSVFANLLAIPLVALMFAIEYAVRLRLLPDIKHVPILVGIRHYFRDRRASPPPTA